MPRECDWLRRQWNLNSNASTCRQRQSGHSRWLIAVGTLPLTFDRVPLGYAVEEIEKRGHRKKAFDVVEAGTVFGSF